MRGTPLLAHFAGMARIHLFDTIFHSFLGPFRLLFEVSAGLFSNLQTYLCVHLGVENVTNILPKCFQKPKKQTNFTSK